MMTGDAAMDRAMVLAEAELLQRNCRDKVPTFKRIDDAAWTMMIYMFAKQKHHLSVGEVCASSLAPKSTSMRQLQVIEARGLIKYVDCTNDRRKRFIRLTDEGRDAIKDFYLSLGR